VLAVIVIELAGREVARRSLLHALLGRSPGAGGLVLLGLLVSAIAILRKPDHRRAPFVLAALFAMGLALQLTLGARLQSDGFYYYAYLRSMAFDRDVNFANDYRMLGLGEKSYLFQPTRTGYAHSAWTIGPALLWAPFFGAGHLVAMRLQATGSAVAVDGTSFPYRQAVCVASLFYGLLGCWMCYRLARRIYSPPIAVASVVFTITGSFMLWYLVKEPTMTHASSMASVAGFTWMWLATRDQRTLRQWAVLGLLAGLMTLIRWQNLLFALLPGCDAAALAWAAWRSRNGRALQRTVSSGAIFLGCLVLAFLPQMLAWRSIYGSLIARSPIGPEIRWLHPHLVDVLWSARNGLLSTSPILYAGGIGLVAFAIARPGVGLPALLAVFVMTYFNGCIQDWWGSDGFGGRRFDGTIPLFCLGFGTFAEYAAGIVRRHALAAVFAIATLFAVWNIALMGAAQNNMFRLGETLPFDRAWGDQAKILHGWFGNPFSYPASLAFALRNGVSPGAYDLLSTNRFLGDPLRPYGRIDLGSDDDWLIADGWHDPERDGPITFRWASNVAQVHVPLDHAATLRVQVRLHAFAFSGAPPQTLTVSTPRRSCGPLPVGSGWETVECLLEQEAWRSGVNTLTLRFDWARRPMEVGAGNDPRPLAAAVDYVRVSEQ
jgi:hypothetical protein